MKLKHRMMKSLIETRVLNANLTKSISNYPGLVREIQKVLKEDEDKIYQRGKWAAGWILSDNSIVVSKEVHHMNLRVYYLGVESTVDVWKLGWIQLWNRGISADRPSDIGILSATCDFKQIDRLVNLVVNTPAMYKHFYKIEVRAVVRGREIEREIWLKEDKAEKEVGFSLLNPYKRGIV